MNPKIPPTIIPRKGINPRMLASSPRIIATISRIVPVFPLAPMLFEERSMMNPMSWMMKVRIKIESREGLFLHTADQGVMTEDIYRPNGLVFIVNDLLSIPEVILEIYLMFEVAIGIECPFPPCSMGKL